MTAAARRGVRTCCFAFGRRWPPSQVGRTRKGRADTFTVTATWPKWSYGLRSERVARSGLPPGTASAPLAGEPVPRAPPRGAAAPSPAGRSPGGAGPGRGARCVLQGALPRRIPPPGAGACLPRCARGCGPTCRGDGRRVRPETERRRFVKPRAGSLRRPGLRAVRSDCIKIGDAM